MSNETLARYWMTLVGVTLVAVGILGFFGNPLVGPQGLVATGTLHNIVHLATGGLALAIALGTQGSALAMGTILFGLAYGLVFVVTVIDPSLFGLFEVPVNAIDHVIHIGVAAVSVALGLMARGSAPAMAAR